MTVAVLPSGTQTLPNGRTTERSLHTLADQSMTREARARRVAWRLDHLDLWQAQIETLQHYQPWYPYDIAHEYEYDWTTDPDYCAEGIALFEFDENGMLQNQDERSQSIETHMRDTARDRVGYRVVYQTGYVFVPEIAVRLGRYTAQGKPANAVKPDLIVMPSEEDLYVDKSLPPEERGPRPDDPVPELVLEVLSESTAQTDLNEKRIIYETLGVHEYLVYDLGGKRSPDSPRALLLYRLDTDGRYRAVQPDAEGMHWSDVFDARIRMQPAADDPDGTEAPVFQWYDQEKGYWRDHASDKQRKSHAEGRAEGRTEGEARMALQMLDRVLPPDADRAAVEDHWTQHGLPDNVDDLVFQVMAAPDRWREVLDMPAENVSQRN